MKYIHKPKTKNFIIFITFLVMSIFLNLLFFLMENSIVEYNLDMILIIHMVLPIVYSIIFCMLFSYLLFTLETIILNFKSNFQLKILSLLGAVEICAGILIILFVAYLGDGQTEEKIKLLSETINFKILIPNEGITIVYPYWVSMYLFSLIACAVIMFCATARQAKTKKRIRLQEKEIQLKTELQEKEIQLKTEINQFLGFDYEDCDFYQQVKIPYLSLQQTDGTRGEFEVYHMLRKSGLTKVSYIFNREIPKNDGLTTELDLIVIHNKGIFVIENKHYTTRVYGNASDYDLTIIDHSGNKKSIYNPIKQNENHVVALKEFLKSKDLYISEEITPIYSIVVFTAGWDDKTDDIISGITTDGVKTKVCTSQNISFIINQLIATSDLKAEINVFEVDKVLSELPIRKKYS